MVMPTRDQVAGIIWAECAAMRESPTVATSFHTYQHRLAVGICVVNRGRQNLLWVRGSRQTAAPREPSAAELANPAAAAGWEETLRATTQAMATIMHPLDVPTTLEGAQLYFHTWRGPICGHERLGGRFVVSIQSWDPRSSRIDGNGREWRGARHFWLCVHVIESIRDRFVAGTVQLETGC